MIMSPRLARFALTVHVVTSVGLLGAVAVFLVLAITGLASPNAEIVRGAYIAMSLSAWLVIVPLTIAALVTGIIQSLGTTWGLFRHYWLVVKLVLTIVVTIVLLLQMKTISYLADTATEMVLANGDMFEARISMVAHSGVGLLVLLLPTILSTYKPRGRTRYGWRKLQEQSAAADIPA